MTTTLDKRDFLGATFPEWMYQYISRRARPTIGPRAYTQVTAGLHYLRGNRLPYFTVTAETWEKPNARDCIECGCLHDDVLRLWPQLAPIVRLHLSDSEGMPMHADSNGWYWLAGYYGPLTGDRYTGGTGSSGKAPSECLQIFADHVRIGIEDAKHLAHEWQVGHSYAEAKPLYLAWMAEQRPRWKAEADAAIALLDELRTA